MDGDSEFLGELTGALKKMGGGMIPGMGGDKMGGMKVGGDKLSDLKKGGKGKDKLGKLGGKDKGKLGKLAKSLKK